jgi:DNA polymerase-4
VLREAFGERGAARYHLLRGEVRDGDDELRTDELPRSISRETTFWTPSSDYGFAESMLFYLTERLGRALRRRALQGRTVQVKLRYADFSAVQRSHALPHHTDRDEEVFRAARSMLRARWLRSRRLRLVGVGLTDLRRARTSQSQLFDSRADRSRRLDRCLDELRERFGFGSVRRGPTIELIEGLDRARLPEPARQ